MMFCLFLCERTERGILHTIDRRVDRDLLHRFEIADASTGPFLAALETASRQPAGHGRHARAAAANLERRVRSAGRNKANRRSQSQAALWEQSLEQLRRALSASRRPNATSAWLHVLDTMVERRERIAGNALDRAGRGRLQAGVSRDWWKGSRAVVDSKGEVVKLQAVLADNLRLLRETGQIDEALHGLTAAIHLLTARWACHGHQRASRGLTSSIDASAHLDSSRYASPRSLANRLCASLHAHATSRLYCR